MIGVISLVFASAQCASAAPYPYLEEGMFGTFIPRVISREFETQTDVYPVRLTVVVPHPHDQAEVLLDLERNRELLSVDWELSYFDDQGEHTISDQQPFACHYHGTVRGEHSSTVAASLCDELGMKAVINLPKLVIEVLHGQPVSSNKSIGDSHVVYNAAAIQEPALTSDDGPLYSSFAEKSGNDTARRESVAGTAAVYLVSDQSRMSSFASPTAEAKDAQSLYNGAQTKYKNTKWKNGDALVVVRKQEQNPKGWKQPTESNVCDSLKDLAAYKKKVYADGAVMTGLTNHKCNHWGGLSFVGAMCGPEGASMIAGIKPFAGYHECIAHENGHVFGLIHCEQSGCNPAEKPCVMDAHGGLKCQHFCDTSITKMSQVLPKHTCLSSPPSLTPTPTPTTFTFEAYV